MAKWTASQSLRCLETEWLAGPGRSSSDRVDKIYCNEEEQEEPEDNSKTETRIPQMRSTGSKTTHGESNE